jgi:hypothetical protein
MRSMSSTKSVSRRVALVVALAGAAVLLGACGGGKTQHGRVLREPSPELKNIAQRPVDERNTRAWVRNANYQMMHNDIDRFFLNDRPSRLQNVPTGY